MAVVCAIAYCVGNVIRFNIRHAEPLFNSGQAPEKIHLLERASDLALVGAYVVSVCLYINILSSFLLRGIGEQYDTPVISHILTALVIVTIGLVGFYKGLQMLTELEDIALATTLLIIAALLAGFTFYDIHALATTIQWPVIAPHSIWDTLTVVGGTLIVVQGFETSRYLGKTYDTETRIRSCRLAQIVSTVVYLLFILLATPLMHFLGDTVQDNDLIMLAAKASVLLPLPLVIAAVLSQFSAAVADTLGGAGNAVEATHGHVDSKHATLLICGGAVILCFMPTMTILSLASRAFAFYYLLQSLVASNLAKTRTQAFLYRLLAVILGFITIFAVPAG